MPFNLKKVLLGLSPEEATFHKRRFPNTDPLVQTHLESVIRIFIEGYNLSLQLEDQALVLSLDSRYDQHHLGFAYEGTGLYFGLLDLIFPKKVSRLYHFTKEIAPAHDYIISVGAGFALARIPWGISRIQSYMKKLDPLLAWCLPDGLGFHEGIFKHNTYIEEQKEIPEALSVELHQLFNSGVGRSIWWVKGGDPELIQAAIEKFPENRKAELWCGIGLACTYAGGIHFDHVSHLLLLAGVYGKDFLSGIPFACRMRQKGKNPSLWTNRISEQYLQQTSEQSANRIMKIMEQVTNQLPKDEMLGVRAYKRIREALVTSSNKAGITV